MKKNNAVILVSSAKSMPEYQCDCACEDTNFNVSDKKEISFNNFKKNQASYSINPNLSITQYSDYYALYGEDAEFLAVNQPALDILDRFSKTTNKCFDYNSTDWLSINQFIKSRTLVKSRNTKELKTIINELSIWLHITDRCNLRCDYCYLPHKKHDMDFETGKKSIDVSIKSALKENIKKLKIKFAGGEAMILFPLVLKLNEYARQQTKKYGLVLDSVILSNGTLFTLANLHAIKKYNIRLAISLDGLDDFNSQRSTINGQNSFEKIKNSLDLVQSFDIPLDIAITISGKSVAGLAALTSYLLDKDIVFSYNFYRENSLSSTFKDLQLEEKQIIKGMLEAFEVIKKNPPKRSLLSALLDRGNLSSAHNRTCSVGQSYMVFDYQGKISKCQMQMSHKVSSIDSLNPLLDLREDKIGIQNLHVNKKEECKSCEWKHWCTGGCPLLTYKATGRYDLKSPNCNIYKAIYPEVIKLEMHRLLHHYEAN